MSATITPGGVPSGARLAKFASTRLLHEWSQIQPWDFPPVYEMRLGPTPLSAQAGVITPQIEAVLRLWNRYADMIGVTPAEIQVIEAKMLFDPGAISQVEHYVELAHLMGLSQKYPNRLIVPIILVAINDPILQQRAEARGIRVIVYTPAWANDWVNLRYSGRKLLPAAPESSE
jgi:hypothetical protein